MALTSLTSEAEELTMTFFNMTQCLKDGLRIRDQSKDNNLLLRESITQGMCLAALWPSLEDMTQSKSRSLMIWYSTTSKSTLGSLEISSIQEKTTLKGCVLEPNIQ